MGLKAKLLIPPGFTAAVVAGKLTWKRSQWENVAFPEDGWENVLPVSSPWDSGVYLNAYSRALASLQQPALFLLVARSVVSVFETTGAVAALFVPWEGLDTSVSGSIKGVAFVLKDMLKFQELESQRRR